MESTLMYLKGFDEAASMVLINFLVSLLDLSSRSKRYGARRQSR